MASAPKPTPSNTAVPPATAATFNASDFLEKPLSHKVAHPLPTVPDSVRLTGLNYLKWSRFVETTLRARQLFKHCTAPVLPETHVHYAAWDAEEQFILGWFVTHSLTPEFHDRFPHQKTVKEFWDQAQAYCGRAGDYWQLFDLIARATALRQGTLSISEYALAHKTLWDEVDYYLPMDDLTCLSYRNTLLTRFLGFLNGLNREYDDVRRRALRCMASLPKMTDIVKELKEEESHFLLHGVPSTASARESSALLTPSSTKSILGQTPNASRAASSSEVVCSHCGRVGHTRDRCYKLHPELLQKKKAQSKALLTQSESAPSTSSTSAPSTSAVTLEQLQSDLARLRAQMTAMQASSSTSFFGASTSPYSSDKWYCGHTALTAPLVSDTTWVLDSGATEHMTPFNTRFISYQRHTNGRTVLTANGGRLAVAGIGSVYVDGLGAVHQVLHVPALRAILMSPQRLVDSVLCSFHLQPDGMFLSDKVGRTTPIRRAHGLLLLDDGGRSPCFMVQRSLSSVAEQRRSRLLLTHQRLGHPPFSSLQRLFPSLCTGLDLTTVVCEACQLAKHRRSTFSPSESHSSVPLFRVHSDVWGPAPQASLRGHRYFLIFVDEATRYTWTFLLAAKSEVSKTIRQFCTMVQTQFGRGIQRFRSDNARDFFNSDLDSFFAERGILHESSCVATPAQNGIAERRIGYVTSTARTLLLNYQVPWSYWGEAILTSTHLVNRLPSQRLGFRSPLDRMNAVFPDVQLRTGLLPRVFGCTAYVHDTSSTLPKLAARALRCVFTGYSAISVLLRVGRCYICRARTFLWPSLFLVSPSAR